MAAHQPVTRLVGTAEAGVDVREVDVRKLHHPTPNPPTEPDAAPEAPTTASVPRRSRTTLNR